MASNNTLKLYLLLAAAALLSVQAHNNLTDKVCGLHTDVRFCRAQLGKFTFHDLPQLATASLDLTKTIAIHTKYIKDLVGRETNVQVKSALEECLTHYSSAADAIDESRESFLAKDYWKMNNDASAASTAATTCEDGFVEAKLTSPLSRQNIALHRSAQIVQIVANVLGGKA